MKALTLTQPWAWLVVHGGKSIENRKWNTKLRGRFLIHASKRCTDDDYLDATFFALEVGGIELANRIPPRSAILTGGIVGVAELVDVVPPTVTPELPWHMSGQYGFVLRNVRPLPFQPCSGALGFWNADRLAEVHP